MKTLKDIQGVAFNEVYSGRKKSDNTGKQLYDNYRLFCRVIFQFRKIYISLTKIQQQSHVWHTDCLCGQRRQNIYISTTV